MAKRSLQASPAGINQAKERFALKGWTQQNLADEIGIKTRQPIWRFFAGHAVERHIFFEICHALGLDWREIAVDPPAEFIEFTEASMLEIDTLVEQVRSQRQAKINDQCGLLQLIGSSHPVKIDDIYIDVNILAEIASQQWLEISELDNLKPEEIDRFGLGKITEKQIPGIQVVEMYSKLRVLGKPGKGKTTFLKYLAIQCNQGRLAANQVPIFIKLRDFAERSKAINEFSLFDYIHEEFLTSGVEGLCTIKNLLQAGRIMLLMDGMDEVRDRDIGAVLTEIRRFSEKYYKNRFVVTCRTASHALGLQGFTDVEIAPFTQAQIAAFAQKWFVTLTKTTAQEGLSNSVKFIEKLDLPENWQFRRLISTPLFLHLACWVFHRQEKFPIKKAEFYKQGLDLLLGKWDEARGIERDGVYGEFSLPKKLKLLSQIASATFEQGQYFFEKQVAEQHISDYIRDLPGAIADPEEVQLESAAILRTLEAHHGILAERAQGIFSFSYLAFQEYLTAKKIVTSYNLHDLERELSKLVGHVTEPHWREVFLLTAAMLRSADGLVQLMKQRIDALVSQDPYLQEFLTWANRKSETAMTEESKPAVGRAFYLAMAKAPHLASDFALACTLEQGMFLDAALEDLLVACAINGSQDFAHAHVCGDALSSISGITLDLGFQKALEQLSNQIQNADLSKESFQKWCQASYAAWARKLNATIVEYRNINHRWEFSTEQQEMLQHYYDANQLLLDCLNSNCEVTPTIRQEIEATLLLPQKELEEREWQ